MNRTHSSTQPDDVQNITTARTSHSDEMRGRMAKYAIAMGIRLVCFALLFFVDGWWKLLPIAGAVFIPWFAVIIANGGSDTAVPEENALLDHAPQPELEAPAQPAEEAEEPVVLEGEIIPEEITSDPGKA
ncbi:DUF3099 domain-containing protein [Psychromicrobium sp. YIM B11713]|uniref:DUF3099 domain-containing protein n=1 Tax=Psychromicrobium sp. YIM B11713 TaxID=3145233 RepID=UPI00374E7D96